MIPWMQALPCDASHILLVEPKDETPETRNSMMFLVRLFLEKDYLQQLSPVIDLQSKEERGLAVHFCAACSVAASRETEPAGAPGVRAKVTYVSSATFSRMIRVQPEVCFSR